MKQTQNFNVATLELLNFNAVSQLAKTSIPSLNALLSKDLAEGRHAPENSCAPTHAGGFFDFDKIQSINPFKIHKMAQNNFLQIIPLLCEQLEKITIVFHNQNYVNEVFEAYHSTQAHLFLEWVKTFAIIRKSHRTTLMQGVIQSHDEDFLSAMQLFKLLQTKPKQKKNVMKKQQEKIWHIITTQFADTPFSKGDIQKHLTLTDAATASSILKQMFEDNKIKLYQPIQKKKNWYQRSKPCSNTSHKVKQYQLV